MTPAEPARVPDPEEAEHAAIVAEVLRRHAAGEEFLDIARALGVRYHIVSAVVKGRAPRFDLNEPPVIVPARRRGPRTVPAPIKGTGGISDIVIADRR